MQKEIRLSSTLRFDTESEADILDLIDSLNSSHMMGKFVNALIRVAVDNPELLTNTNGRYVATPFLNNLAESGISEKREKFLNGLSADVADLKNKVDKLYELGMQMYLLAQMGKTLGLEEKATNLLSARFLIQKNLTDIMNIVGISEPNKVYVENKVETAKKLADDTLEYVLNTYNDIINELRQTVNPVNIEVNTKPVELDISVKELEIPVKELEIPVRELEIPVGTIVTQTVQTEQSKQNGHTEQAVQVNNTPVNQPTNTETNSNTAQADKVETKKKADEPQSILDDTEDDVIDFGDFDISSFLG